jgi:hypothetical protein
MSDTQLPDIGMVSTTEIECLRIRFAKGDCDRGPGSADGSMAGEYLCISQALARTWEKTSLHRR